MENEAQIGIDPSVDAQLDAEARPRASEDSDGKKDSVRVHVHDATPLLQQSNGSSGYATLPPYTEGTGAPVGDDRSWRRKPSVSCQDINISGRL